MTLRVGEGGKAVNDVYGDRYKLMDVAREIEKDFGLRSMDDVEKRQPQAKILKTWERFSGAETGYTARRVGND